MVHSNITPPISDKDITLILNILPFKIINVYQEDNTLNFYCETKNLSFWFDVIYQLDNTNLYCDYWLYWDYNLSKCDFQNDIKYNIDKNLIDKIHIDYNNFTDEIDFIKSIFNKFWEDFFIVLKNKENKTNKNNNWLYKNYTFHIEDILNFLKKDNNVFSDINKWPLNCYAVSCNIFKYINIQNAVPVYWKWFWFVSKYSPFDNWVCNHWWIEFVDENNKIIIIDPTRWVFEWLEPYIYVWYNSSEYDRAWQKFQMLMRENWFKEIPLFDMNKDKKIEISFWKEIDDFIYKNIFNEKYNFYFMKNIFYLANTPIVNLQPYEKIIFHILIEKWYSSYIPEDTKELVFWVNFNY
jgi:hypothetical protein